MKNIVFIEENDFQKARNLIKKNKSNKIIFSCNNDDLNRKVIEKESIDIILINLFKRKDRLKQKDSGMNHVIAKLIKKKSIVVGINLDEIVESSDVEKGKILGRIKQNIKLCNKNKINMCFVSKKGFSKDIYDLKALCVIFGMPTFAVKNLKYYKLK